MSGSMPTDLSRRAFMATTTLAALSSGVLWTQDGPRQVSSTSELPVLKTRP